MKDDLYKTYWVECSCFSSEHCIRFIFNPDDREIYMEPFLDEYLGFWGRLWAGIKYIFGHKSNYGHFDSVVVDIDTAIELRDKLDDFVDKCLIDKFNEKAKDVRKN